MLIRVRGGVNIRDGFRVTDRAMVRARGGMGFIYHSPNLLEVKLCSGRKYRKNKYQGGFTSIAEHSCIAAQQYGMLLKGNV